MPWRRCKICSTPGAREFVDSLLDDGEELRVISARLALLNPPVLIDKSSIHRHSKRCYSVRERAAKRKAELASRESQERRLIVEWPEGLGQPHRFTLDGKFLDEANLRDGDILLGSEFESLDAKNPAAPPEEREQPMSLVERVRALWNINSEARRAQPEAAPQEKTDPPAPTTPEPCQHKTMRETPGGPRCEDCGFQPAGFVPIGSQSRKDYFSSRGRARFG